MKNANKAETSREAKALSVVAKIEKKSRAKGKPAAATVSPHLSRVPILFVSSSR